MNDTHEGLRPHRRPRRFRDRRVPARRRPAPALALALLLAGCSVGSDEEDGLDRSEFVEIVTALREVGRAIPESDSAVALFETRKAEILAEHGVTEEELRAYLRARGDDVEALQETWDTISERLRYLPGGDTLPSDTVPPDTVPSDTVPSDTVPSDTVPSDTVPPDTAAPDTLSPADDTPPSDTAGVPRLLAP